MSGTCVAVIPARMGSKRLPKKNLQSIAGVPLIVHAIRRCRTADCFDEIWVNSESDVFQEIANDEGVAFHRRPAELASDVATSESYVYEFLQHHVCDLVVQVHSIAPLLGPDLIRRFVHEFRASRADVFLSVVREQIECLFNGKPVNFSFEVKENSQRLSPVFRIPWSITGWRRKTYMAAFEEGKCATYAGDVRQFEVGRAAGHVIKTQGDLDVARALAQSGLGEV